jgi:hypothetical protein
MATISGRMPLLLWIATRRAEMERFKAFTYEEQFATIAEGLKP